MRHAKKTTNVSDNDFPAISTSLSITTQEVQASRDLKA
jgi:hypothetical protein